MPAMRQVAGEREGARSHCELGSVEVQVYLLSGVFSHSRGRVQNVMKRAVLMGLLIVAAIVFAALGILTILSGG